MSKPRHNRTDWEYLRDIADATAKLRELTRGMTLSEFQDDWRTYHAAFSLLEIVGEAGGRISTDFRARFRHIPWRP